MKATQDLYKLIRSLSKTEKSYFKKFAVRHNSEENNSFLKLFSAFDNKKAAEIYDEDDIKAKFKDEGFVRQLPVMKNYLYNNILKSLNMYYMEEKKDIKLNSLLNSADILFDKELYTQALKILQKAKEYCYKNEIDVKLLEVILFERKILRINQSLNEVADVLRSNYAEEELLLQKMTNIAVYKRLYDDLVLYASAKGTTKNKEELKELEDIIAHDFLTDYSNAKFLYSKMLFHFTLSLAYNLMGNVEKQYYHSQILFELIGEEKEKKMIYRYEYLLTKQNMISTTYSLVKVQETEMIIEEILEEQDSLLATIPRKVRNFMVSRTLIMIVGYNVLKGDFVRALELLKEVQRLTLNNNYRDEELVANYMSAVVWFGLGNNDQALKHINWIFNSKAFMLRRDVHSASRIFSLIIHYELGNTESLEYFIKSTYRFLRKTKKLLKFEILILKFIRELVKVHSQEDLNEILKEKKIKLKEIFKDPEEWGKLQGFDLISWIDSKLTGRKYGDLVKENSPFNKVAVISNTKSVNK